MNKQLPELVVSASGFAEAERLLAHGADAVTVGEERFALRAAGEVDLPALKEIVLLARTTGKKVYVLVNALLHHDMLEEVETYIREVASTGADALIFGDPAVYMLARRIAPAIPLHWSAETTSTNYRTVNFWARKGASRALLARELSLGEVEEIKRNSAIPVQVQVHGMTCIFHSKRQLVTNYLRGQQKELPEEAKLFLKEHTRDEQVYPIFQDRHGTHIMSCEDLCMLPHLEALMAAGIDAFYIEGWGKSCDYNTAVVELYRQAINRLAHEPNRPTDASCLEQLRAIQPTGRPLGTGFYFKEQIY